MMDGRADSDFRTGGTCKRKMRACGELNLYAPIFNGRDDLRESGIRPRRDGMVIRHQEKLFFLREVVDDRDSLRVAGNPVWRWNQMRYELSTHFFMQSCFVPPYPRIFLA